jgi:hypothetical protein
MKIKQAKRDFGTPGTKRLRKQWQTARNRGKEPFAHLANNVPNTFQLFEQDVISLEKRIYNSILVKVQRVAHLT